MNNKNDKEQYALFSELTEISFAMDELRLYLDTHPTANDAVALYKEYMTRRSDILAAYTEKYGDVEAYRVNAEGGWGWTAAPMPWETEAN